MKKFFLLLAIFTSVIACDKDEEIKMLTPEEQAKADDDQIVEYMKSHKFEDFFVGEMENNVDWKIVPIEDQDPEETQSLFELMGENIIDSDYNGVDYKLYYYVKDTGKGEIVASTDEVIVDYNVFSLYTSDMSDRVDYSNLFAVKFSIPTLIEGWKQGMEKFNSGLKPDGFPGTSSSPYRELIDTPGRGIFLVPSGLAYGPGTGVLRFDIVVYNNDPIEE